MDGEKDATGDDSRRGIAAGEPLFATNQLNVRVIRAIRPLTSQFQE
jgi:hypothetical protein